MIFPITGFNQNLRKEIAESKHRYFVNNRILNTILGYFRLLSQLNNVRDLWENYLISERVKRKNKTGFIGRNYFWRTYDRQEIYWAEEYGGSLNTYKIKWSEQKIKTQVAWEKAYLNATFKLIHNKNYKDFLCP